MDAEHISKYEAAAMYAYENTTAQTEVTKERNYLILDLEQCSAGFCTCDQKETKLIHNWDTTQTDLWDLCIENLQKLAGGTEREQQGADVALSGSSAIFDGDGSPEGKGLSALYTLSVALSFPSFMGNGPPCDRSA